ncbi:phytoene desaturase family protein [Bacteroides timonensis]|uniref:phytoene desaturase family protein n=1 Tax=Bacteroides timonensis TaxID=1470345 RepID=UPI0004B6CC88|nr:NAD(P)-binding protein [Bacteroides timonensis]
MSKYDIIIIGSGLGGLECGAILSKEGYNVCVLEKNELFGGCFQTYRRKGHLLDTGIHYIGSLDEGQVMNQFFRYVGIMDHLKVRKLDENAFDKIFYKNRIYDYAMGYERFTDTLCRSFPHEKENLWQYTTLLKEVGNLISVDNLKKGIISTEGMKFFNTSAAGMIDKITTNPDLQSVLAGSALLYGGLREHSNFYEHAMINNSYIQGAYRFIDGSMQVASEMINVIRTHGGTVLNNCEVTRIIVENNQVAGVEINHVERIESKYIISNVHPKQTLTLLDKTRCIKNAYISRISSLENTYGIFTLYLIMREKSYPYQNQNLYLHGNNDVWYDKKVNMGYTTNCMISTQASSRNSDYADVISILTPMYIDELSAWQDTLPEQRGEDYKAFKMGKARQLLEFIKNHGIDFTDHIETMYTTTPLSYRDFTGTCDGSAYGIIKDYKCPQIGFVSTRTKLGNLLLTGQNLNVHGALGVTLTSIITCGELLGHEYLAKRIGHA